MSCSSTAWQPQCHCNFGLPTLEELRRCTYACSLSKSDWFLWTELRWWHWSTSQGCWECRPVRSRQRNAGTGTVRSVCLYLVPWLHLQEKTEFMHETLLNKGIGLFFGTHLYLKARYWVCFTCQVAILISMIFPHKKFMTNVANKLTRENSIHKP